MGAAPTGAVRPGRSGAEAGLDGGRAFPAVPWAGGTPAWRNVRRGARLLHPGSLVDGGVVSNWAALVQAVQLISAYWGATPNIVSGRWPGLPIRSITSRLSTRISRHNRARQTCHPRPCKCSHRRSWVGVAHALELVLHVQPMLGWSLMLPRRTAAWRRVMTHHALGIKAAAVVSEPMVAAVVRPPSRCGPQ